MNFQILILYLRYKVNNVIIINMLSADEIKEMVNEGEGYNVDFKRSVPSKVRELTEEVCGFLNAAGGYLLIGVSDNNRDCGCRH